MKQLLSLIAAAAVGVVGTQAPAVLAAGAACAPFAVPVSIKNCNLPGFGNASAFVSIGDVNKTKWDFSANLFVGGVATVILLDKNGNSVSGCFQFDNTPNGTFAATKRCTTGAGVPKTAEIVITI